MGTLYSALFREPCGLDDAFKDVRVVYHPEQFRRDIQALILWGGGDIDPSIYGHKPQEMLYGVSHRRDTLEVKLARAAIDRGIPIIGICRGAQLMCALSGGSLYQHVFNHAGESHTIETKDGRRLVTNSLHHQMMNPSKVDHELIAWSSPSRSPHYIGNGGERHTREEVKVEPEVVYFPKTKALCIQGHPEYLWEGAPLVEYALELTKQYVLKDKHA